MPFSSLFDLKPALKSLTKALSGDQIAGTYLFVGPQGVGKTALAMAFAEAAACLSPQKDPFESCGKCDSCRLARSGQQPEILLISPPGEQTQIWQFWDRDGKPQGALQHTLQFAPSIGKRRVYIIERADTLTESAANSLLKVLEEPPPYALFILLTPHAARMLPTVLSRSQIIRLAPAPVRELAAYLASELDLPLERAQTLAAYAEGRTGTALRLARSTAVEAEIQRILELAEALASSAPLSALKLGEGIRKTASSLKALTETDSAVSGDKTKVDAPAEDGEPASKERVGRKSLGVVIDLLAAAYRDLLALRLCGSDAGIVHGEYRERLAEIAERGAPERWMACLETLLLARRRVDQNAGIPLLTDWLAVKLVNA
jgi:DNA polymerase-3 subunit delta'